MCMYMFKFRYMYCYISLAPVEEKSMQTEHPFVPGKAAVGLVEGCFLSTTKTQNAKRTFWNARSKRRGGFSGFMMFYGSQKPPNPFFAPCKKDSLCYMEFFNNVSKSS